MLMPRLRSLWAAARGLGYPARLAWRRPRLSLLLLALLLPAGGALGSGYLHHQWRAAQAALAADRPDEALGRLRLCLRVWPSSPEVHLLAARAARLSGDVDAAEAHLNR